MLRRLGAIVAVLAFVQGFSAAPYTHAHHEIASVSDEHHPHGDTLVHTHVAPHAHHDDDQPAPGPAGQEHSDEQIWSVDSFVCQQPVLCHAPLPALLTIGEPHVHLTSIWLCADRGQPKSHGPPIAWPSRLRAPPASLPTLA